MVQQFISWFINKYWDGEYYLKSDLEKTFDSIRYDEATRQQEYWQECMRRQRLTLDRAHHIREMEWANEMASLQDRLNKADKAVKMAEDLQYAATVGAQRTLHTSSNIKIQVCKLRDMLSDLSGTLEGVENEAQKNFEQLEKNETKYLARTTES